MQCVLVIVGWQVSASRGYGEAQRCGTPRRARRPSTTLTKRKGSSQVRRLPARPAQLRPSHTEAPFHASAHSCMPDASRRHLGGDVYAYASESADTHARTYARTHARTHAHETCMVQSPLNWSIVKTYAYSSSSKLFRSSGDGSTLVRLASGTVPAHSVGQLHHHLRDGRFAPQPISFHTSMCTQET
jgi:hypothetical protein